MKDEKKCHQRRAIVVKGFDRDDSILIGHWSGRRKYVPGITRSVIVKDESRKCCLNGDGVEDDLVAKLRQRCNDDDDDDKEEDGNDATKQRPGDLA